MFSTPKLIFGSTDGVGSRFNVFALGHIFGGAEGVGSRFHVLCSRTRFRWFRRRRVPFSCFALPDTFSAVRRASCPVIMFCAPRLIFGRSEGIGFFSHVLLVRTRFRWYRGRLLPFSCFALLDSFSMVSRASAHVFMFCTPGLVFRGTEGVGTRFHVLRARTHFRRYRERLVAFSFVARPDLFSAVPRASAPVFMFCASELIFDGTDGVGSRFHVLRTLTHFRLCGGRQVRFSCFALLETFSAVRRASGPVFMFCSPGHVFGGAESVGSCFHVWLSRTRFRRFRGRRVLFSCFASPHSFLAV
jgi:hypothetical protein